MFSTLLGEFGLVDLLVLFNAYQGFRTNKYLKKMQKLQAIALLTGDDELKDILKLLKEKLK